MKQLITLTILLLVFAGLILAQTNTWKSSTVPVERGKWNTATNWSLSVVPTSSHDVVIPTIPVNQVFFPTLNSTNASCKTLTIQSGARVTGSGILSLTVSGDLTCAGTLNVVSSPVNVSGNVNITGSLTYTTGRMDVTGTLTRSNLSGTGIQYLLSANNYIDITTSGIAAITIQAFANTAPPNTPPEYDATKAVKRYYTISGVTGTGEARPRFDYLASEIGGSFTPTNANVWQYISGPWVNSGVLNAEVYYAEPELPLNESSLIGNYAIADAGAALPVQLASFVGSYVNGNDVQLEWMTITEINNFGFNVQRYNSNAKTYDDVGFVAGKGVPYTYTFLDENVNGSAEYRLEQIDNNGLTSYFGPIMLNPNSVGDNVPAVFALNQNYPNPFNPATTINFSLVNAGYTTLKVYNILGNEVATLFNGNAEAGKRYEINFNAQNIGSGLYFYKLQSGSNVEIKKMTLIK